MAPWIYPGRLQEGDAGWHDLKVLFKHHYLCHITYGSGDHFDGTDGLPIDDQGISVKEGYHHFHYDHHVLQRRRHTDLFADEGDPSDQQSVGNDHSLRGDGLQFDPV